MRVNALLIRTEGHALEARVEIEGHRLVVLDAFSDPGARHQLGLLQNVELRADDFTQLPWEDVFSGNPNGKKGLVQVAGWTYLGYGEIIRVNPMIVDVGIAQLEVSLQTHDERCIGQFVRVNIDRLSLYLRDPA